LVGAFDRQYLCWEVVQRKELFIACLRLSLNENRCWSMNNITDMGGNNNTDSLCA
jgi:hypothetical protein